MQYSAAASLMKCRRFFIAGNYSWRCHQSQLSKRNQQPQHNKYKRKNKTASKIGVIMVIIILQSLQYLIIPAVPQQPA